MRKVITGATLGLSLALLSAPATAELTKDQCVDADTQAQNLRREGKLAASREALRRCGDPSCPAMVRDDCSRRTEELEKAQPTILFDVKDGAGHDLAAVRVTVDGQPLVEALDGTALRVDPGPRSFTFTATGLPSVTQTFVLKEGEKERRERVTLGVAAGVPAAGAGAVPTALPSTPPEPTGAAMGGGKLLGLVLGGAGVAALGVGGVFGLLTASAASQQKTDCASPTSCAHYSQAASDHTTAQTDGTISTIGFIAGGALLAGGAALFFLSAPGHPSDASPAAGFLVTPTVGPGGAGMSLRGEF